ncbi:hypothetical protein CAAN1_17S01332 [[Candida] anglica]|uniref:MARVEL domain-containing protein n=1 Tax=[Candida] anglica TaxID=148631 RepID=A0ABP0E7H1_9ASCO
MSTEDIIFPIVPAKSISSSANVKSNYFDDNGSISKSVEERMILVSISTNSTDSVPNLTSQGSPLTDDLENQSLPVKPMTNMELFMIISWTAFHVLYCISLPGSVGYIAYKIYEHELCKFEILELLAMGLLAGFGILIGYVDYNVLNIGEFKLKWASTTAVLKGHLAEALSYLSALLVYLTVVIIIVMTIVCCLTGTSVFNQPESVQTTLS